MCMCICKSVYVYRERIKISAYCVTDMHRCFFVVHFIFSRDLGGDRVVFLDCIYKHYYKCVQIQRRIERARSGFFLYVKTLVFCV